jgi:hypothetical protein
MLCNVNIANGACKSVYVYNYVQVLLLKQCKLNPLLWILHGGIGHIIV